MKTGKSYIGFAWESGVSTSGVTDVAVLPLASGYRDSDTQELKITTHYAPRLEAYEESGRDKAIPPAAQLRSASATNPTPAV